MLCAAQARPFRFSPSSIRCRLTWRPAMPCEPATTCGAPTHFANKSKNGALISVRADVSRFVSRVFRLLCCGGDRVAIHSATMCGPGAFFEKKIGCTFRVQGYREQVSRVNRAPSIVYNGNNETHPGPSHTPHTTTTSHTTTHTRVGCYTPDVR